LRSLRLNPLFFNRKEARGSQSTISCRLWYRNRRKGQIAGGRLSAFFAQIFGVFHTFREPLTLHYLSMRALTFLTFIAVVPLITGCGAARPDNMVDTAPATITVLQNGSPMSGVVVTLFLDGGNPSLVARSTTDGSGDAVIRTSLGDYTTSGAPVGVNKVTLDKEFEIPPSRLTPDQVSDLTAAQAEAYEQERREALAKARIIPADLVPRRFR